MKKVIVVGAGFGGLNFIRNASSNKEIEFTLIDKQNHHLFQPLLYQVATAVLSPANIAFPIRRMFKKSKNVKVVLGEVTSVDRDKKNVELDSGINLSYDQLVIATGSLHSYFGNDSWSNYSQGLKGINDALVIRENLLKAFEKAENELNNEIKQEYEAVSGTMPLNCSIKDLFSIINAGAKVISGPGGLATILAFTSSDILVLQKKVVVDAGTINSTYRGEKWTSLDMVGAVKRGIPWRVNLREAFFDENIENTLSDFVGETTND